MTRIHSRSLGSRAAIAPTDRNRTTSTRSREAGPTAGPCSRGSRRSARSAPPVAAGSRRRRHSDGGDLLERLGPRASVRLGIAGEIPSAMSTRTASHRRGPGARRGHLQAARRRPGPARPHRVRLADPGSELPAVRRGLGRDVHQHGALRSRSSSPTPTTRCSTPSSCARAIRKKLHTYEDIVRRRPKFATGTGYAEIDYAVEAGVKESDILILPDQVAGLNAVEPGRVDVFAGHRAHHPRGGQEVSAQGRGDRAVPAASSTARPHIGGGRLRLPAARETQAARRLQRRAAQDEEERRTAAASSSPSASPRTR